MTKLKTLKDLKRYSTHPPYVKPRISQNWVLVARIEELREEAIKWYHRSDGNKHKFIREFFNITEDELK